MAVNKGFIDSLGYQRAVRHSGGKNNDGGCIENVLFLLLAQCYLKLGAKGRRVFSVMPEEEETFVISGVDVGSRPGVPDAGFFVASQGEIKVEIFQFFAEHPDNLIGIGPFGPFVDRHCFY